MAKWDGEGCLLGQELLPKALFDVPEVGRPSGEGGAIHVPEIRGKEVGVVPPEVRKEVRVFVESQEGSPTISMVRISGSESVGPRAPRGP